MCSWHCGVWTLDLLWCSGGGTCGWIMLLLRRNAIAVITCIDVHLLYGLDFVILVYVNANLQKFRIIRQQQPQGISPTANGYLSRTNPLFFSSFTCSVTAFNCDNTNSFLKFQLGIHRTCTISKKPPLRRNSRFCSSSATGHISGCAWRGQLEKGPANKSTCCVHWQHLRDDVQKWTREPSLTNTPLTWISKCCFWCVPRVMNVVTQILTAGNIQAHQGCRLLFQLVKDLSVRQMSCRCAEPER